MMEVSPELVSTLPFTFEKDDAFSFLFTSIPSVLITTPSSSKAELCNFVFKRVELAWIAIVFIPIKLKIIV